MSARGPNFNSVAATVMALALAGDCSGNDIDHSDLDHVAVRLALGQYPRLRIVRGGEACYANRLEI